MALRLLPFRQYDEQDVVNLFALGDAALESTTGDGNGSNGVFVKISDGNFDKDTITYATNSYLGKTDYPFAHADMYPSNPLQVTAATSGTLPLGLTLNQTAKTDENGEKLIYNTTKKEELQAVLPGQTVPVATKGIFTLSANAFDGSIAGDNNKLGVGSGIKMSNTNAGKLTGVAPTDGTSFGTVIGTGNRVTTTGGLTDQFGGEFVIVKIG